MCDAGNDGASEANNMKKFLGVAAIVFLGAIPAHAQRASGMGGSSSAVLNNGGGSTAGSGIGGSVTRLPVYPRATFATATVSGGDPSFSPSSFMTFEQAVAEGIAESQAGKSLAQAAADNQAALKSKSRVEFVQDHGGKVIPVTR
jgi:hypothetical protein